MNLCFFIVFGEIDEPPELLGIQKFQVGELDVWLTLFDVFHPVDVWEAILELWPEETRN